MVVGGDAGPPPLSTRGQAGPQQPVVHHVHKGHHGVPALVVVPHLEKKNWLVCSGQRERDHPVVPLTAFRGFAWLDAEGTVVSSKSTG